MRRILILLALVIVMTVMASPALAHPLGNFTTNSHLGVDIGEGTIDVRFIVDMAEIPTFREPLDADDNGNVDATELEAYASTNCEAHRDGLDLTADTTPVDLEVLSSTATLLAGQSDLQTLRLDCAYRGEIAADTGLLEIENRVYDQRVGWVELVVTGGSSDGVPATSPSELLTEYPETATLDQRRAVVAVGETTEPTGGTASESDSVTSGPITGRLANLLEGAGSTGGLIALVAAVALGATHALAPGHGKTLMAAYLVGRKGTPTQAAGLGLAVAVSHTLGVGVLGLVTALASSRFQPESVYPWLTTGSALIVSGLGIAMLVRAFRKRRGDGHHHGHDHGHDHGHGHHHPREVTDLGWRSLAALGLAGGLVPSASAVVLLLGAVAIGRTWFGVGLVFAFGVGMSIALVLAGLVALRISTIGIERLERRWSIPARLVPTLGGLAVTAVGFVLLWDATVALI